MCIALLLKYKCIIENIKKFLDEKADKSGELSKKICNIIHKNHLDQPLIYTKVYEEYKTKNYLYDYYLKDISSDSIMKKEPLSNQVKNNNIKNISSLFYEGFGFEI